MPSKRLTSHYAAYNIRVNNALSQDPAMGLATERNSRHFNEKDKKEEDGKTIRV
jgi:hypothetical protein